MSENSKLNESQIESFSVGLGTRIRIGLASPSMLSLFRGIDVNLQRAEMRVSFRAYVGLAVLTSLVVSISTLTLTFLLLFFILELSLFYSILFGVGFSLFSWALTVIIFYSYPAYRADKLKRRLEDELPFATGYMAILAGSGIPPDRIFRSLARIDSSMAISKIARVVVRDVELFGYDILTALERVSARTPSEKFKQLLEGLIATIHSGGNLMSYLMSRANQYMKLKHISLRKFADTLSVLAEFYVTFLVAGPLLLVVMLAVMAMLGGGEFGFLDPRLMLYLIAYIGIPVGSAIFLIILDAISPG